MNTRIAIILSFPILFYFGCNQTPSVREDIDVTNSDTAKISAPSTGFDLNNFQELVDTYEDPDRGDWQNPDLIIETLGDINKKTIADIGAGTGYFTFRLAARGAKAIAIDIDERFLDYIDQRKNELSQSVTRENIETRLSKEDDPLLASSEVDAAIFVNTYSFLDDRTAYLIKIYEGLKEGGALVIVDYRLGKIPVGPIDEFKVQPKLVSEEVASAGFKEVKVNENALKYQYLITAKK